MMKVAHDDESESDGNTMHDLGTAMRAPVIKDRASDDSAHNLDSLLGSGSGSVGYDMASAKQNARKFNALSVTNTGGKNPVISFGQNNANAFGSASDGGSDEGMQMGGDNESEASGMMQMAEDDDLSNAGDQ